MIFSKGVADYGVWGNKFFGRVVMQESHIGDGCLHKVWRAKVIYGLEPMFESGHTCIVKVRNYISYSGKGESCLTDKNLEIITQVKRTFNFSGELITCLCAHPHCPFLIWRNVKFRTRPVNIAKSSLQKQESLTTLALRLSECNQFSDHQNITPSKITDVNATLKVTKDHSQSVLPRVLPVNLMYRPANAVPYVTVDTDLPGDYQRFSVLDQADRLNIRAGSDVEQKCCALQHWIFQRTNGNMLLTRLEGTLSHICW